MSLSIAENEKVSMKSNSWHFQSMTIPIVDEKMIMCFFQRLRRHKVVDFRAPLVVMLSVVMEEIEFRCRRKSMLLVNLGNFGQ